MYQFKVVSVNPLLIAWGSKLLSRRPRAMSKQIKVHARAVVDSPTAVQSFFEELIPTLGMVALTEALVVDVPLQLYRLDRTPFEDEGGISCIQMLSTSHVAMHTWPLREKVELDVYSCRSFNPDVVEVLLRRHFKPHKLTVIDLTWATAEPI